MIWVANDVGSKELLSYFSPYDVPVECTELEFGDFVFYGNGIDGPCSVAVERKTVGFYTTGSGKGRIGTDLPQSIRSGRLSGHQVPGLFAGYDYIFFLLEGVWKDGPNGEVVVPNGHKSWMPLVAGGRTMMYRELANYVLTLQLKCGGFQWRTGGVKESVAWLVGLYHWFQKEWGEHTSHEAIYTPYDAVRSRGRRGGYRARTVGPVETVASQLPGVARKAYDFGKVFKSVRAMAAADAKKFEEVEGIGKKGAVKIVDWFRQGEER